MDTASLRINLPERVDASRLAGPSDCVLRSLEQRAGVSLVLRGSTIKVSGPSLDVETAVQVLHALFDLVQHGRVPSSEDAARLVDEARSTSKAVASGDVLLTHRGRSVRARTSGQQRYLEAIQRHTITFCLGPAGTGKTYLAMAVAVAALRRREIGRIVQTRPVVEAGENLGFLPGTLEEKVDPYVRPLLDALYDLVDAEKANDYIDKGQIEIAPLAYMRGRTLNDAFVILDEAQNTTPEQMKMFLTRLGFNSKFIVTGDASQRDLPGKRAGLTDIEHILGGVDDIAFIHLGSTDVVRHSFVGKIVEAYEAYEAR